MKKPLTEAQEAKDDHPAGVLVQEMSAPLARVWIPVVHGMFAAILLLLASANWQSQISAEVVVHILCWLFFLLAGWCLVTWRIHSKRWIDTYSIFLLAAILFNGGQCILEVFHLNLEGLLGGRFSSETLVQTVYLVTIGIAFLHFGALCTSRNLTDNVSQERRPQELPPGFDEQRRLLVWIGGMLALFSLPAALLDLASTAQAVSSEGYMALYQGDMKTGVSAWPEKVGGFLVPGCLLLLSGGRNSRICLAVSGLIVFGLSLTRLYLGIRFYALMPMIIYAWLWHRCVQPIPARILVPVGVGLVMVVLPLIRSTREVSGNERLSLTFLSTAYSELEHPALQTISELGGSMRTIAETLQLVPHASPYQGGESYLYAALTVIPSVSGELHPSIARGTPSQWLIECVDPETAAQGGGLGFSFIAEAYLNFGWPGTPLLLGLLGFAYAWLAKWGDRPAHAVRIALLGCCVVQFTFYARSDASIFFRWLIWYCLGPYLLFHFVNRCIRIQGMNGAGKPAQAT